LRIEIENLDSRVTIIQLKGVGGDKRIMSMFGGCV